MDGGCVGGAQVAILVVRCSTAVVLLDVDKQEVAIDKTFIMITTAVKHDPWVMAEEEGFSPWVVITPTRGMEEGMILRQTPL
jgi:hypothetical protein